MIILDGRKVSEELYKEIKIDTVKKKICIILIGNNEDSIVYVNMKKKKCLKYNIETEIIHIENIDYKQLIQIINDKNIDKNIDGIMVQLPLPNNLKKYSQLILDTILYSKDIDGLTSNSIGKLAMNYNPKFKCCTPYGIIKLLNYYNIEIKGSNITIVGYSNIVGKPLSLMLSNMGGTVSVCTIDTKNIKEITKTADILITCCGCPKLINQYYIKNDVIIIDVGINISYKDNKKIITGDVDFESVKNKVKAITPVPGGVGPMTIYSLINQILNN